MKYFLLLILSCCTLAAQELNLTPELLEKPFFEWEWNITTLLVISMFAGRVINYAKVNGGIRGLGRALWFGGIVGENTPKQKDGKSGKV